jgi:ABC-type Zn uptake system ZnuABC Zn-binding protein ZnuA
MVKRSKTYSLLPVFLVIVTISYPAMGVLITHSQQDRAIISIVTTHPVLASLIKILGDGGVEVIDLIPPGVDPHEYEPPLDIIRKVGDSDVIIIDALHHLPISDRLYSLYSQKTYVLLDELRKRGWSPQRIPGLNVENLHEVFYDRDALNISIDVIKSILTSIAIKKGRGDLAGVFETNSEIVKSIASRSYDTARSKIIVSGGLVVSLYSPVSYYLLRSVGVNVSIVLTPDPEVEPSPQAIRSLGDLGARCLLISGDLEHLDLNRLRGSLEPLGVRIIDLKIIPQDPVDLLFIPLEISWDLVNRCSPTQSAAYNQEREVGLGYTYIAGLVALAFILGLIIGSILRARRVSHEGQ